MMDESSFWAIRSLQARLERAVASVSALLAELDMQSIPQTRKRNAAIAEAKRVLAAEEGK